MVTTLENPPDTDPARLDALADNRLLERSLLAERLLLVAEWADAHPGTESAEVLSADEHPGGDGTPTVAAFTAEPLAHALDCSPREAQALLADALDLRHRHPRLWDQVMSLVVPLWKARRVVVATRPLPREGAHWVDRQLLGLANTLGVSALDRLVSTAIARFSPDLAALREDAARSSWDVTLQHPRDWHGTSTLQAVGDTHALLAAHRWIQRTADGLPPSDDTAGQRRSQALILLVRHGVAHETLDLGGAADPEAGTRQRHHSPRPALPLFLHLDLADLLADTQAAGSHRVGTVEGLGPATLQLIRTWCGGSHVSVQPVLDLADRSWSPRHDPPPRMAAQVVLRDPRCVFPRCTRPARLCDLDHITRWTATDRAPAHTVLRSQLELQRPRPPEAACGTTSLNLAPLCRRHHRAKTAQAWTYGRQPDGSYWWTGPHGQHALVTHQGTATLP